MEVAPLSTSLGVIAHTTLKIVTGLYNYRSGNPVVSSSLREELSSLLTLFTMLQQTFSQRFRNGVKDGR